MKVARQILAVYPECRIDAGCELRQGTRSSGSRARHASRRRRRAEAGSVRVEAMVDGDQSDANPFEKATLTPGPASHTQIEAPAAGRVPARRPVARSKRRPAVLLAMLFAVPIGRMAAESNVRQADEPPLTRCHLRRPPRRGRCCSSINSPNADFPVEDSNEVVTRGSR